MWALGVLCKGKPAESGSVGQMSHLGVRFLNAAQLSQTAPSPGFISTVEQRWVQCTKLDLRLSLGSVLELNHLPLPPARLRAASAL